MPDSRVRFGLIGFGAWGKCHAAAIAKSDDAELIAIAAHSEASCAAAKDAWPHAEIVADYRELLERDDLDVVDVVLPSHLHHEVASAVLTSGRHLLLEKPMCLSIEQCDDLIALAKAHDRLIAIGHELRLSSLWGQVKQLIDDGFLGEPRYVMIELSRNPYRHGAGAWRYDINRVGNWILEEPIHFFDLARWYLGRLGEPETIYAAANSAQPNHPELQDNFSAIIKFPREAQAIVSQTLAAFEHHQTAKVTGTKGAIEAKWSGAMDRTRHPTFSLKAFDGQTVREIPIDKPAGELFELEDQIAMLVQAIREGKPLACTAEDGRWSVAMCLAAEKSVRTGRPVGMGEIVSGANRG